MTWCKHNNIPICPECDEEAALRAKLEQVVQERDDLRALFNTWDARALAAESALAAATEEAALYKQRYAEKAAESQKWAAKAGEHAAALAAAQGALREALCSARESEATCILPAWHGPHLQRTSHGLRWFGVEDNAELGVGGPQALDKKALQRAQHLDGGGVLSVGHALPEGNGETLKVMADHAVGVPHVVGKLNVDAGAQHYDIPEGAADRPRQSEVGALAHPDSVSKTEFAADQHEGVEGVEGVHAQWTREPHKSDAALAAESGKAEPRAATTAPSAPPEGRHG